MTRDQMDALDHVAHHVDVDAAATLDVLGPTVSFLTPPDGADAEPCVMRGTMPPGVVVPLHSHADPETFLMLSGELEGLTMSPDGFAWVPVRAGDVFHVPPNAKHAWRNTAREPAVTIIVSTIKLGRFFRELGAGGPTVARLLETAARYGYWNATPEENAQVGLRLAPF
jgi:quercetin dioxygenase-like cupin family protein